MGVEVGDKAPDFTLKNQFKEEVKLADFQGEKNVLLMFYPFAFSGICTGELCAIRDERPEFDNDDVVTLAVSTDAVHSLRIFADQEKLEYPLLSDHWPHGEVAKQYGVFDETAGAARRGTFLIDKQGVVVWSLVNDRDTRRDELVSGPLAAAR